MSVAKSEVLKEQPEDLNDPDAKDIDEDNDDANTVATSAVEALSVAPSGQATEIL